MTGKTGKTVDELLCVLTNLRLMLRGYEYEAVTDIMDILNNPADVAMARRILNMIDNNGASTDDIKSFCETYIKSWEEE